MRNALCAAMALAMVAGNSFAQNIPLDRAEVVVNWTNAQRAIAQMIDRNEALSKENAALEARLETAMEWLKSAQGEARPAKDECPPLCSLTPPGTRPN